MNARTRHEAPRTAPKQLDFFAVPETLPAGFCYAPDLIGGDGAADLATRLANLPFQPFDFHGHLANRRVVGFGLRYDYANRRMLEAPPIPDWLISLRETVGLFAVRPPESFVQVLINEYRPGAGIGWHRDKPHFGEVVGVSLLAPCTLRFRCKTGETWDRRSLPIDPCSAYLLSGPSRTLWEHSIPPLDQHRYSVTFRTLAIGPGDEPRERD